MKNDLLELISDMVDILPYNIEEDVISALLTCYETLIDLEMELGE